VFSNLKLIGSLKGDLKSLQRNLLAGLIVGIVSIPLSMAFAIASGLRPENGLYTSIVAGMVVAIFGGSKVQIAGPTGAFVALLATITAQHGITGLQTASIMAGMLMVLMSLFKLGNLFKFVPITVILGFTTGIGLIILQTQLHTIFGTQDDLEIISVIQNPKNIHFPTLIAFGLSMASLLIWQAKIKKIPGPLFLLVFGSFFCLLDAFQDLATIGNTYGTIPSTLPVLALPKFDWYFLVELIQPAVSIALLGSIESILSASAADQITGDKHHPNRELRGQGLANLLAPCWERIRLHWCDCSNYD
jgi:sulfate permease, SulP family